MIDPFKENHGYLLRRASTTAMTDLAKRLKTLDLRPTEATVLLTIDTNLKPTLSEIGRLLEIASANMAPLIARLEGRDLIRREPMDGRSHALSLTPAGEEMTERIKQIVAGQEADLHSKIPSELRGAFLKALRDIWKNA